MQRTNLLRQTIFLCLIFASFAVSAQGIGSALFKVVPHEDGLIQDVHFMGAEKGKVTLRLFDDDGKLVYQDVERKTLTVDKRLNLKQLPQGNYTLTVEGSNMRFQEEICLKAPCDPFDVSLDMGKDQKVRLTVVGNESNAPYVKLYSSDNQVVNEGPLLLDEKSTRTFDLSQVRDELVTFVVIDNGAEVHKGLRLK